ncbi:MAG TPA: hypothetical protein VMW50_06590 [Dehalococcoidia bacterium]|nr:hypothetical protein [Dehalococcoidia bacterium]
MTKQQSNKSADVPVTVEAQAAQVIYADRILNMGFGVAVSRFTLGWEMSPKHHVPLVTIVMPTPSFLEALDAMVKAAHENVEMKKGLIATLDTYREQLSKL